MALMLLGRLVAANSPVRPADAIVVFAGEDGTRLPPAAGLWRQGIAPTMVLTHACQEPERGTARRVRVRAILDSLGVTPMAVQFAGVGGRCVRGTRGEAAAVREFAVHAGWRRVRIVTNWYHARRARWMTRRALRGHAIAVDVSGVQTWQYDDRDWWRYRTGWAVAVRETLKLGLVLIGHAG